MADPKGKFPPHGLTMYSPKTGEYMYCFNDSDLVRAKEQGFTSSKYVKSRWPATAYHKKTGESKAVGKLGLPDEQNQKLVKDLGPDWTLDHVAVPEPVAAKPAEPSGTHDASLLAVILAEQAALKQRIVDLEEAAVAADGVREGLESRIAELENRVTYEETDEPRSDKVTEIPAPTATKGKKGA